MNAMSFPAENLDSALELLSNLRVGLAELLRARLLEMPVMCSLRASEMALSPEYEVLGQGATHQGGRYRDTVLFFLSVLDQSSPAHANLSLELHEDAINHAVEGFEGDVDVEGTKPLVACGLDRGVLLSIETRAPWTKDRVVFSALLSTIDEVQKFECDNVCNAETAKIVGKRLSSIQKELKFANWDILTNRAARSPQIINWFEDCLRNPGLEQLIMRTVNTANKNYYMIDGDLIKKLHADDDITLYELRAYFSGSNNVRLLFNRGKDGRVYYGFGGMKTSPDWYVHAIQQAIRHINDLKIK